MIPSNRRPGWDYHEVKDLIRKGVLEVGDGYRAKNSEMGTSGLPFARAGNLNNGFRFENADILCETSVKQARNKLSRVGDVTFTSKGTFGRFAFVRKDTPPFVYSPQLCYWRMQNDTIIDRRFLYYWMQGDDCMNQLNEVKDLTDMAAYVSLSNQRNMWICAPPLSTQRRIASILSVYDDLIENNTRRIAILEEMARRLYEEWFVQFRFPGHEELIDEGGLPTGWGKELLKDAAYLIMGLSPKSEFYNRNGEGLPFHQGVTDFGNFFPTDRLYCTSATRLAKNGDILFSVRAPVGRINLSTKEIIIGRGVAAIRSKRGQQVFLFSQLRSIFEEEDIMGNGAIFKAVTKKDMETIQILMPPASIVSAFEQIAAPMWELIRKLTDKNANLRAQRDLLLPKLISGEIDVSNLPLPGTEEQAA